MADTGTGTTITFGTTSWTGSIISIGGTTQSREALEDSHLGTSGEKTFVFDDLIDPGSFDIEFYWDQSASVMPRDTILQPAETITISFPLKSGESTNATFTGSGGVVEASGPDVSNGELMTGSMTIQWDGKTGPSYTAGS